MRQKEERAVLEAQVNEELRLKGIYFDMIGDMFLIWQDSAEKCNFAYTKNQSVPGEPLSTTCRFS